MGDTISAQVIRSRRKTISMQITGEELLVKAPVNMTDTQIREFLEKHRRWIGIHMRKAQESARQAQSAGQLTMDEIRELADQAMKVLPPKVKHYAEQMGVTWGRITIRNQRSLWGSCSSKGNLNFNCLLMLCPDEVIDSVVVHELAHRKEMNHSERFYDEILKVYPDYYKWNSWLKENGPVIMKRMTGPV